ncbi:MAG: thiol-disulfide oxidoreductase ResA [Marinilabiliales bacterium]
MKKIILLVSFALMSLIIFSQTENKTKLPSVNLKTLDGKTFNTNDIDNAGNPIVISFWATWCKPCISELNTIKDEYEEWQEETGVKIIAVSTDDSRSSKMVGPRVNGFGWEYDILLDQNQDLKKALNVNEIPHVFLLDGDKNIVWQHKGYTSGDEEELYEAIKKLSKGEPLK